MTAEDARRKSIDGAINSIETIINHAVEKGLTEAHIPETLNFGEEVQNAIKKNGFKILPDNTVGW